MISSSINYLIFTSAWIRVAVFWDQMYRARFKLKLLSDVWDNIIREHHDLLNTEGCRGWKKCAQKVSSNKLLWNFHIGHLPKLSFYGFGIKKECMKNVKQSFALYFYLASFKVTQVYNLRLNTIKAILIKALHLLFLLIWFVCKVCSSNGND